MTDTADNHHSKQEIAHELSIEFVDESRETLQGLEVALDAARNGHKPVTEVIKDFRRVALLLRGQAPNFGLRSLSLVAHRLYDYLGNATDILPPRAWEDLQGFIDTMTSLLGTVTDEDATPAGLVRALPCKLGFDFSDIVVRNVEVMLVMPNGTQTRFVERELTQCGYRVSIVTDTLMAFALIVQAQPDLVIISAVMPHLDGIDLSMALASMPSTRNIPLALITSFVPEDDRLKVLPQKIPVVYKGATFGDDLFKALDNLFLI
jgi:CheY-like chemotaxis protein/HPt (histidine-containing phosphotransfer) domain-containing protein